jgi:hypothetical protein
MQQAGEQLQDAPRSNPFQVAATGCACAVAHKMPSRARRTASCFVGFSRGRCGSGRSPSCGWRVPAPAPHGRSR